MSLSHSFAPHSQVWAAGTVLESGVSLQAEVAALGPEAAVYADKAGCVPYRVKLDSGAVVLVHRDEHWLVRDLALQAEGPRQAADGYRCLRRLEKRRRDADGTWEELDHATRRVRPAAEPRDDDESDED